MLLVENVSHKYAKKLAVSGVSLSVRAGEVAVLAGPSGCGKTTVLKIIAGLERPCQGRVVINGRVAAGGRNFLPPEKRRAGLMFQNPCLFPHLTVLGNVEFGAKGDKTATAMERLSAVGMAGSAGKYPHELSGGEQQRVALARALAAEPEVMLLDEPFASLDPILRRSVRDETLALLKASGVPTLMVTHDPEEAMRMADRIYVMGGGKIVQEGSAEELYYNPADRLSVALFGEPNHLYGRIEGGRVQTVFGAVNCSDFGESEEVEILIRPEALSLAGASSGLSHIIPAIAENVRFMGISSIIHALHRPSGARLRIRGSYPVLPKQGEEIYVKLSMENIFIFRK